MRPMKNRGAIILAGGQGKRFKSATSKVLHSLAGRPLIDHAILLAKKLKLDPIVAVVPPRDNALHAYLRSTYPTVILAVQSIPRGTGDAIKCAKKALTRFEGDLVILSGDVPLLRKETLTDFYKHHQKSKAQFSLMTCAIPNPTGYGRVVRNQTGDFSVIVEERDATADERAIQEVNCGIYWSDAQTLFQFLNKLSAKNAQGEYYLTDLPEILARAKRRISTYRLHDPDDMRGINTRRELALAAQILYARTADFWMDRGVTLIQPETILIDPSVTLSADCIIESNCHLRGDTKIGSHTYIRTGSVIESSEIGAYTEILPYSIIRDSEIGDHVHIGPFAHVRPGSILKSHAKVGNFVELKKSILGVGAKANHLSYIGDTVVGDRANIGAGTITCNYDGKNKFKTEIGNDAFIGSNSSLIAPVKIGKRSVVGAGSAIRKSIPDDALGLTRAPQIVITRWSKRPKKNKKD